MKITVEADCKGEKFDRIELANVHTFCLGAIQRTGPGGLVENWVTHLHYHDDLWILVGLTAMLKEKTSLLVRSVPVVPEKPNVPEVPAKPKAAADGT